MADLPVELAVPFDTVHLDQRDDALVTATDGRTPCVVADTSAGLVVLVAAAELKACDGDPQRLVAVVERNATARGLGWSTGLAAVDAQP